MTLGSAFLALLHKENAGEENVCDKHFILYLQAFHCVPPPFCLQACHTHTHTRNYSKNSSSDVSLSTDTSARAMAIKLAFQVTELGNLKKKKKTAARRRMSTAVVAQTHTHMWGVLERKMDRSTDCK